MRNVLLAAGLAMSAIVQPVLAQLPVVELPAAAQPGLLPAALPPPPPQAETPMAPFVLPGATRQQAEDAGRAARAQVRFPVRRVLIAGSSVYSARTLRRYTRAVNGRKASLEDLQQLAERLTRRYQRDGYVLSQVVVPPQQIETDPRRPGYGIVRLQAVEGYLHRVGFIYGEKANRRSTTSIERATQARLLASRPLRVNAVERSLLLLQDTPGATVQALVRAGGHPGTADLDILLGYRPVQGYVQLDNRTARYFGPLQLSAGVEASDVFCDGGRLSLRAAAARGLGFAEAAYTHPLVTSGPWAGLEGSVLANGSSSHPGEELAVFDIRGRSRRLAVGVSYPVIRARANTLRVRAALTADSISSKALGSELFDDEVRAVRVGADWTGSDHLGGINTAAVELAQGMDALGATRAGSSSRSRAGAAPDFRKLTVNAGREQLLSAVFAGSARSIYLGVSGQWADEPLLASEEFGLGGVNVLSAYDPNTVAGDRGLAVRLEVRHTAALTPDDSSLLFGWLRGVTQQQYVFGEVGTVRNLQVQGISTQGEGRSAQLASAGFGWRWLAPEPNAASDLLAGWSAALELAQPVATGTAGTVYDNNAPRAFFRLSKSF